MPEDLFFAYKNSGTFRTVYIITKTNFFFKYKRGPIRAIIAVKM